MPILPPEFRMDDDDGAGDRGKRFHRRKPGKSATLEGCPHMPEPVIVIEDH